MYDQLKARLAALLGDVPRVLPAQSERQLTHHLAEHPSSSLSEFLLCAADVLEEYELDILFGPVFTPTLDERAQLADLLFHWRPARDELTRVVSDLCAAVPHVSVQLPDGTTAKLRLHEVMAERFVKLLRLDAAADAPTNAALRDALPADLWPLGVALLCERGMTPEHQKWFAAFINHIISRRTVSRGLLESVAEFISSQQKLDRASLMSAAEALMRATQGTAAHAAAGHTYWSPDVAQHHHYRGQGRIDKDLLEQRQAELEYVTAMVEDLRTFET